MLDVTRAIVLLLDREGRIVGIDSIVPVCSPSLSNDSLPFCVVFLRYPGYVPIVMLFPPLNEQFYPMLDSYTEPMGRFYNG